MISIQAAAATTGGTAGPAYVIYDGPKPIGQVEEPRGDRVTGRGAGTVLLKR